MSETPEPRYCAPGDGVEGGYAIGCDPAVPEFDLSVFLRIDGRGQHLVGCDCGEGQIQSDLHQVMGIPAEYANQSMSLKMDEFVAKYKEMQALRDQEVAEFDDAVKAAVDKAVDEHGTKALFIQPRIESDSITGMYFALMAQKAINQELETRRKLLFQKAAETTNEEDNE